MSRHLRAPGPGLRLGLEPGVQVPERQIGEATVVAARRWCGTARPPIPCGACSPGLWDWGRTSSRVGAQQAVSERGWGTRLSPSLPAASAALAGSHRQRDRTGSGEGGSLAPRSRVVGGSTGGQERGVPFHPSSPGYAPRLPCGPHLHHSLCTETGWRLEGPTTEVSPLRAQPGFPRFYGNS